MSYDYRAIVGGLMLLIGLGLFSRTVLGRFRVLQAARPETRWDLVADRVKKLFTVGIGQSKMFKEPASGWMHAFTFWGFCILGIRTTQLFVQAFAPGFEVCACFQEPYDFVKDITEFVVLAAIIGFVWRRLVVKPARIAYSGEALLILGFIGGLMVTDFIYDGAHFASLHELNRLNHAPIGGLVGQALASSGLSDTALHCIAETNYVIHLAIVLTFLNLLPLSKHFHVITSLPNVFLSKLEPKGALSFVPDIEKALEEEKPLGLSKVADLSWKQVLDLYTCTECGRCEVNCPAWNTDKPLNPKMIILDLRDHVYAKQKAGRIGKEPAVTEGELPPLIGQVNVDAIWACTTCRSCSEQCPVMIEHVDKILDIRRHLVMTRNEYSKEVGLTLKNVENKSNPWGMASGKRGDWAKGLDIPTLEDKPDAEWLYYVGCAGSFDDRAKEITLATVKILKHAGVSFAILGKKEKCTGDSARRIGNEYLFQEMAKSNIEQWRQGGVKKIITTCPHCFNTIANEYPQLGGNFEVVHHSVLFPRLIAEGKLQLKEGEAQKIIFHDSCYMGRHNDIYDEPRAALRAIPGTELVEIERSQKLGMCCGAGGSRMFMEEKIGTRINDLRVEQLMQSKPQVIASSCPFCMTMLSDGIGAKDLRDSVKTKDIAELIADRLVEKAAAIEASPPPEA